MGQVARPNRGVSRPKAQINADFYVPLLEVTRNWRFVIICNRKAIVCN
jgi:hypothetical protein